MPDPQSVGTFSSKRAELKTQETVRSSLMLQSLEILGGFPKIRDTLLGSP